MTRQGTERHALRERGARSCMKPRPAPPRRCCAWSGCPSWFGNARRGAVRSSARWNWRVTPSIASPILMAWPGADSGIATPIDFLLEHRAPPGCRCTATNPPLKLANQFIRHGLTLADFVIVLLRAGGA